MGLDAQEDTEFSPICGNFLSCISAFQHLDSFFLKSNSVNIIDEGEDNTPSTKSLVSFPIVLAFPPFSRLSL